MCTQNLNCTSTSAGRYWAKVSEQYLKCVKLGQTSKKVRDGKKVTFQTKQLPNS